jgi:hypothetical protein
MLRRRVRHTPPLGGRRHQFNHFAYIKVNISVKWPFNFAPHGCHSAVMLIVLKGREIPSERGLAGMGTAYKPVSV